MAAMKRGERKETERTYNMNKDGASFRRIWLGIEAFHLKRATGSTNVVLTIEKRVRLGKNFEKRAEA